MVNGDTRCALIIFFFVLCVRANDTARNNFRHFENMLSLLLYPNHCETTSTATTFAGTQETENMATGATVSLYSGFRIISYYLIYPYCCVAYEALYCTFGPPWFGPTSSRFPILESEKTLGTRLRLARNGQELKSKLVYIALIALFNILNFILRTM